MDCAPAADSLRTIVWIGEGVGGLKHAEGLQSTLTHSKDRISGICEQNERTILPFWTCICYTLSVHGLLFDLAHSPKLQKSIYEDS